jgi:hypothetical protein
LLWWLQLLLLWLPVLLLQALELLVPKVYR